MKKIVILDKSSDMTLTTGLTSAEFRCKCDIPNCHYTLINDKLIVAYTALRIWHGEPLTITSGYRCQHHNIVVSGVANSRHTIGSAIDILLPEKGVGKFVSLAKEYFPFIKVYKHFIHCDVRNE